MTTSYADAETFMALFDGNRSAVGTERGGCIHLSDPTLWPMAITTHLTSQDPDDWVGVYPVVPSNGMVKWACVDFDAAYNGLTTIEQSYRLCDALRVYGVRGWIEPSRSKGHHVWVFLEHWAPASLARRAIHGLASAVGVSTREVNPKQEHLAPGQLGNYVRLPYPGGTAQNFRRAIIDTVEAWPLTLRDFLAAAVQNLATVAAIERIAAEMYVAPSRPRRRDHVVGLPSSIAGLVRHLIDHGPRRDRSTSLQFLAHAAFEAGCSYDEALRAIMDVDDVWRKYADRSAVERMRRYEDLLERAGFTMEEPWVTRGEG